MSTAITPQQTGTSNLGSRNPFLQLVTPQTTGATSANNIVSSGDNASPSSPSPPTPPAKEAPLPAERTQSEPVLSRLEPQRTGALNSSPTVGPSSPPRITVERSATLYAPPAGPPPPLPPRGMSSDTSTPNRPSTPPRSSTLDILQEELPPEYTPGPNAYAGEQSVEFGPLRPFQDPNAHSARPPIQPSNGNSYFPQQRPGPSRAGANPGSLRQALGTLLLAALTEPPRRTPSSATLGISPGARNPSAPYGISIPAQPSAPHAPYSMSQPSVRYQPASSSSGWSQYPGQRPVHRQRSLTPEPQARLPDDGKPTNRPTPGHPLLRDGMTLVYPLGYECRKCFNKGFKPLHASTFDPTTRALAPGDPSHPCKHCWRHYSRHYNGALAQLNWKEAAETNFQRPIADPDVIAQPRNSLSSPMVQGRASSPGSVRSPPPNFNLGYPGQSTGRATSPMQHMQGGPIGRTMYEPGDPRIGGRLCPRCRGSGRTRVFILESEICNLCRGAGRVF